LQGHGSETIQVVYTDNEDPTDTITYGLIADSLCGDGFQEPSEACDDGNTVDGDCCSAACTIEGAGTVCRGSAGVCDVAETCDGLVGACPADEFLAATETCRGEAGICDAAETCTGSSATCPSDDKKSAGTECRAKGDTCDVAETCDGTSDDCPADGYADSGTQCRGTAGVCDVAETCDGTSATCPADGKAATDVVCRAASDSCDAPDTCDGTGDTCPADLMHPPGTECRAAIGPCDAVETCDGTVATCPADELSPVGTECRGESDVCDVAETCTGDSALCPVDGFADTSVECRASTEACDAADFCPGDGAACSADAPAAEGTSCEDDGNVCTDNTCDDSGTCLATPNTASCDDANACTTADTCADGSCVGGAPLVCADGELCTDALCDPTQGCVIAEFIDPAGQWLWAFTGDETGDCAVEIVAAGAAYTVTGSECDLPGRTDFSTLATVDPADGSFTADAASFGDCSLLVYGTVQDGNAALLGGWSCGSATGGLSGCRDTDRDGACDYDASFCDLGYCDEDSDGICDNGDICAGGDDLEDEDGDEVPDACDICGSVADGGDADLDGIPDGCDPCVNGGLAFKTLVKMTQFGTGPGDDKLKFKTKLIFDQPVALRPQDDGFRLLLTDANGDIFAELDIPPGLYDPLARSGWVPKPSGTRYMYLTRTAIGGMEPKVILKWNPNKANEVVVIVAAKRGEFAVPPVALPLDAMVSLKPLAPTEGLCGEASFPGPKPVPYCRFNGKQTALTCK
ncbi:hypothetical protein OAL29_01985, partial [Candidatus Binatia bacterium]|nr:hypothetical protein [Candidatus Binatia bacterium]